MVMSRYIVPLSQRDRQGFEEAGVRAQRFRKANDDVPTAVAFVELSGNGTADSYRNQVPAACHVTPSRRALGAEDKRS